LVPDRRNLLVAWLADHQGREGESMPTLPGNPNLEQLRHQAGDLLRAARAGEREATERIRAVSDRVTLSGAQLAIARGYGLASWPALRAEVEARTRTLAEAVEEFRAKILFELEDLLRERRLGDAAALSGTAEAAGVGDGAYVAQLVKFHR